MTRGRVALLAIVGLVVAAASGTQTWLQGTTDDAVLGASTVSALGSETASGAIALSGVVLAALVAAMVSGPRLRRVVALIALVAAVGQVVHVALSVTSPSATLGPLAAAAVGRSGSIPVAGHALPWAWVGLGAAVITTAAALLAVIGVGRWPVPSSRYDAPGGAPTDTSPGGAEQARGGQADRASAGPRGERSRSDWDALSEGHDPTDVPPTEPT